MGLFDFLKPKAAPKFPNPGEPLAAPAKKILVVEDDEALRTLYIDILKAENYEVLSAENGLVGLNVLKAQKPDLVLLDLMMPVMDGKEMLRTLRSLPEFKDLPIIVLTNAGDIESMRETRFYSNANAFLIKANVTPPDIIAQVKTFI